MAITISTALANLLAGNVPSVTDGGSEIAFVNSTGRITTTVGDFLTAGFRPGDVVEVTSSSSNNDIFTITEVDSAGAWIEVVGGVVEEAAAAASPTIALVNGKGWLQSLRDGVLAIFESPMPLVDAAETGTLLLLLTKDGSAHSPGDGTNGLEFEFTAAGLMGKSASQDWEGVGLATGDAYWGRFYDNAYITGDDTVNLASPRVQGRVGTSGQEILITSTSIVTGVPNSCTQFNLTQRVA